MRPFISSYSVGPLLTVTPCCAATGAPKRQISKNSINNINKIYKESAGKKTEERNVWKEK